MKSLFSKIFLATFLVFGFLNNTKAADYYVNDASLSGDIWCSAIGNDSNGGTKASPFATLKHTLTVAANGDKIYIDAGTYLEKTMSITVSNLSIIGAGPSITKFKPASPGITLVYFMKITGVNNFLLKDLSVSGYNNVTSGEGEAITISNVNTLTFSNVSFGKSAGGAGESVVTVKSNSSNVLIEGISYVCQTQGSSGGGFEISGTNIDVTINNSVISNNNKTNGFAGTRGGGLLINGDATVLVEVNNSSISDNIAGKGGGIYMTGGILNMTNCCIKNNEATSTDPDYGGGVWLAGTSGLCTFTNCEFSGNLCSGSARGGAIGLNSLSNTINLSLVNCDFSNNSGSGGNDIYTRTSFGKAISLIADNCTFGSASKSIYVHSGTVTITNSGTYTYTGTIGGDTNPKTLTTSPSCPQFSGSCPSIYICNPATVGADQVVTCPASTATISATGPSGSVFYLYDLSSGGSVLDTASSSTPNFDLTGVSASKTYYIVSNIDGCQTRTPINVSYNCPACTTTISYTSPSCQTGTLSPTRNDAAVGTFACTASSTGTLTDLVFISTATGEIDLANSKPGTYTIEFTVSPTCKPTASITINAAGDATTSVVGNGSICSGADAIFTISGNGTEVINYTITGSAATNTTLVGGSGTVTVSGATADQTITLNTATNGTCPTTLSGKTASVTVNPVGNASTIVSANGPICSGADAIFTISGTGTEVINYTITGSPATNTTLVGGTGTVTISSATSSQTITLNTATNGSCPSTIVGQTQTVTVNTAGDAATTVSGNGPICSGADAIFTITGTGTEVINYTISGAAATDVTLAAGTANVTLSGVTSSKTITLNTATNGSCPSNIVGQSNTIVVNPAGNANTSVSSSSSSVCLGSDVVFTISGTAGDIVAYSGVTGSPASPVTLDGTGKATVTVSSPAVSTQTITLTSATNGTCTTALSNKTASVTVSTAPTPTFTASASNNTCTGVEVTYNTQSGNTNYVWSVPGTAGVDYTINSGGIGATNHIVKLVWLTTGSKTVTVEYSIGTCNSTSPATNTTLVVDGTISTALNTAITACGASDGKIDVTGTGTGNLTWTGPVNGSANGVNLPYTISGLSAGSYTVSFNNGTCTPTSTISLTDPNSPTPPSSIDASGPITFCQGGSVVLTANTGGVVPTKYIWAKDGTDLGVNLDNITVSTAGTYSVLVETAGCKSGSISKVVTVNTASPDPTSSSLTPTFCSADNKKVSDLSVNETPIIWYDNAIGGNKFNASDLLTTQSYFAANNASGCESVNRLEIKVTVNQTPIAPTGNATANFCSSDTPMVGDLDNAANVVGTGVIWYSASTSGSVKLSSDPVLNGVTYYASQTISGCEATSRLAVTVSIADPSAPTIDVNSDANHFCTSDTKMLSDLEISPSAVVPAYYVFYSSSNSVISPNTLIVDGASYSVAYNNGSCESAKTSFVGKLYSGSPTIDIPSLPLCAVDKQTFNDIKDRVSPPAGTTINWYFNGSNQKIADLDQEIGSGTYSYEFVDSYGCIGNKSNVTIDIDNGTTPVLDHTGLFWCQNESHTFADLSDAVISGDNISWHTSLTAASTPPASTPIPYSSSPKYYYASNVDLGGCESVDRDSVLVSFVPVKTTSLTNTDQTFCKKNSYLFSDLDVTPNASSEIVWKDPSGADVSNTSNLIAGTFKAYYKDPIFGCVSDQPIEVVVSFYETSILLGFDKPICNQTNGKIYVSSPKDSYTYEWKKDGVVLSSTSSSIENLEKGSYSVVVSDNGCPSDELTQDLTCTPAKPTQLLTPNGDNKNDRFELGYSVEFPKARLEIYNRWGVLVYQSEIPYKDDWDGKPNTSAIGSDYLPSGTYYYVIDKGNGDAIENGYLELVK
jgi:gliding motility-associated-like protein